MAVNRKDRILRLIPRMDSLVEKPSEKTQLLALRLITELKAIGLEQLSPPNKRQVEHALALLGFLQTPAVAKCDPKPTWFSVRPILLSAIIDRNETDAQNQPVIREDARKVRKTTKDVDKRKVFVVHGRNLKARDAMFAFLRSLDLKPMEWSEAVSLTGETNPFLGDILDAAFRAAQAFIVLLTPDESVTLQRDLVYTNDTVQDKGPIGQARPNVIFEAGMAMALFRNRTIVVELGDVRSFSDIAGRHVVRLTDKSQNRQDLTDRLKAADCPVDISGRDWHTAGHFDASVSDYAFAKAVHVVSPSTEPKDEQHPLMRDLRSITEKVKHEKKFRNTKALQLLQNIGEAPLSSYPARD